MQIKMDKLYKETQTIGGYVFEMWGRKPITLSCDVLIRKDGSIDQLFGLNGNNVGLDLEDKAFCPELFTLQTLFNLDQRKMKRNVIQESTTDKINSACGIGNLSKAKQNSLTTGSFTQETYAPPAPTSLQGYLSTFTDTFIYYKGIIYTGFFTDLQINDEGDKPFRYSVHFNFLVTGSFYDWLYENMVSGGLFSNITSIWGLASSTVTLSSLIGDMLGLSGMSKDTVTKAALGGPFSALL